MNSQQPKPSKPVDATGRVDIFAYRLVAEIFLPRLERHFGMAGLTETLKPYCEAAIAELLPATPLIPKPRRKLCTR